MSKRPVRDTEPPALCSALLFHHGLLEMEGGAVVQVCRQFRVSCLVVRSVTDYADGQALASYDQFFKTASENAATVVTRIIRGLK